MLEIETKYYLGEERAAHGLVTTWGLDWREGRFEVNRIFDFADGRLQRQGALVRVRERGDRGWLTYKERTAVEVPNAKVRLEHDSSIAHPGAVLLILRKLGLEEVLRYERYRARYEMEDAQIEIDHLPGGWFCEIEGRPEAIAERSRQAGLAEAEAIVWSYPEIFRRLLDLHHIKARAWSFGLASDKDLVLPAPGDAFWKAAPS
jgi:adenylate cyclase class 2